MKPIRMTPFAALSVLFLALTYATLAKERKPKISEVAFDGAATDLFYFDDSDIVIFTDEQTKLVHRSIDAGGSWNVIKSIPKDVIKLVVGHPFDKHTAIAVGTTMHWITEDRGDSWRSFLTEDEVSTLGRKQPIGFHASDSKKMLIHTARCNIFECEDHKVKSL